MRALFMSAALVLAASPAVAADLTVRNFVGKIIVNEGDAEVDPRGDLGDLDVSRDGDSFLVDGGIEKPGEEKICGGKNGWNFNWSVNGRNGNSSSWDDELEDYPELRVELPEGATLMVENSQALITSDVTLGRADLELMGCLPSEFSDILTLELSKSGSGNFQADAVGTMEVKKSGSGDLTFDEIGTLELSQSGSGDFEVGRIGIRADISKSGSGDVEIDEMDGNLSVSKSGSGDVEVGDGVIPRFELSASGAGDTDIDADIVDADIRASGAGDIYLKSVSGRLDQDLSGSVEIERGDD